ncbi:MAG: 3-hydroxybutyryl-CoA dehydrogenase [SAR116 cluster bacterium]|nr:3-hydroxybutyryl-CoA dehydrogenase [SAR116 cluster bacterium]
MKLLNLDEVKNITSIGAGPIGGGWTAFFLSKGFRVTSYLHDPSEKEMFMKIVKTAWKSLEQLGLSKNASLKNLSVTSDLEQSLEGAHFVQESAPEKLELKQDLYNFMGKILPDNIVISSSTSGFMMSDIQKKCSTPERTIIGHPFNPPYILPLVEIVGGDKTRKDVVDWAFSFYKYAGKAPLKLKKEIPGFVATRLQEALWREALHMVDNGEATPEDIDTALINGPAPRMVVQGQCMAFHVACGEGGMATNLDQFGPALKWPWTRLEAPDLTKELRNKMVEGCNIMAGNTKFEDLVSSRDNAIVKVLNALEKK